MIYLEHNLFMALPDAAAFCSKMIKARLKLQYGTLLNLKGVLNYFKCQIVDIE